LSLTAALFWDWENLSSCCPASEMEGKAMLFKFAGIDAFFPSALLIKTLTVLSKLSHQICSGPEV